MADEARQIIDMVAAAWVQCEAAQLELRRAESAAASSGDLEIRVAVLLDAMMQAEAVLGARLEECRNALAMADAIGLTLHDCTREGATGKAQEWLRAHFEGRKDVFATDLERPLAALRTRIAEMAMLPTLTSMSEAELAAMVESVAITGYTVPASSVSYPNWCNVKCALATVDRVVRQVAQLSALAPAQRAELAAKLRRVQVALFNSDALRFPTAEAQAARLAKREEFKAIMVVQDEPLDNTDFVTAIELAQTTFREVLTRYAWRYRLLVVEGDGNCFFRAVVKGLTPHMPRDFEDSLSLQLRHNVNRSNAALEQVSPESLHEFEVADESDPRTMAQAGVWADHVQMAKVASYLHRAVWLLRCDDRDLRMDAEGRLEPAPHYRIGPTDSRLPPVSLFYQTSPGHFETLVARDDTTLQEALDAKPATLLAVCDCWFRLEEAQSELERLAARGADVSNDWDVRQSVKLDVEDRAARLDVQLRAFQALLRALPDGGRLFRVDVAYVLFGELFEQLLDSDTGPMAQLRDRLEVYKTVTFPPVAPDRAIVAAPTPSPLVPSMVPAARDPFPLSPFGSGAPLYSLKSNNPLARDVYSSGSRSPPLEDFMHDADLPPHPLYARPPPGPATTAARTRASAASGESMTDLLRDDSANLDDWVDFLASQRDATDMSVQGIAVDATALKTCFDAFEARSRAGSKTAVHLAFNECSLDDKCCEVLKSNPRLVTLIKLSKCKYPQPFHMWFKVKQHVQLENCTIVVPVQ